MSTHTEVVSTRTEVVSTPTEVVSTPTEVVSTPTEVVRTVPHCSRLYCCENIEIAVGKEYFIQTVHSKIIYSKICHTLGYKI